jgi:hypothetical protein
MVMAEQAIHHYAGDALRHFEHAVASAMSHLAAYATANNAEHELDNTGFFESLGQSFLGQLMEQLGGQDSPIGVAAFQILDGKVDEAARDGDIATFLDHLGLAVRDATAFLRDNLQSVLTNQWDELRDLAYEGSTEFIHPLHDLGLPKPTFKAHDLEKPLEKETEAYLKALPKDEAKEEKAAAQPEEKEEEEDKDMDKALLEQEEQTA